MKRLALVLLLTLTACAPSARQASGPIQGSENVQRTVDNEYGIVCYSLDHGNAVAIWCIKVKP